MGIPTAINFYYDIVDLGNGLLVVYSIQWCSTPSHMESSIHTLCTFYRINLLLGSSFYTFGTLPMAGICIICLLNSLIFIPIPKRNHRSFGTPHHLFFIFYPTYYYRIFLLHVIFFYISLYCICLLF
ncbi:hypothetical protein BCR42DRAFT_418180, partial [Absidia repens]